VKETTAPKPCCQVRVGGAAYSSTTQRVETDRPALPRSNPFTVWQMDNTAQVRDGYIRLGTRGQEGQDGRAWRGAAGCRRSAWSESAARTARRADSGGDRVDERGAVRARPARARGLAGRDRRRAEGEGAGAARVQPTASMLGCWPSSLGAIWCRRSGYPTRSCARSASGRAGGCTWCATFASLKQRVHAVLLTHGTPCPVSDLFGVRGRQLLARLGLPQPWQGTLEASLRFARRARP
jgi:hypothetical protein